MLEGIINHSKLTLCDRFGYLFLWVLHAPRYQIDNISIDWCGGYFRNGCLSADLLLRNGDYDICLDFFIQHVRLLFLFLLHDVDVIGLYIIVCQLLRFSAIVDLD
jgi:hypothetical protein